MREKFTVFALISLSIVLVTNTFFNGISLNLHNCVTNRARFHAIPVAISQVYHNHKHDYTGIRSIAMPFQGLGDVQTLVNKATTQDISSDPSNYYWVADDRGYSDYINIAFRIFGPKIESLYYVYFLIFGFGLVLFWSVHAQNRAAMIGLILMQMGMNVSIFIIPLSGGVDKLFGETSIPLFDSRLFDLLSMPYLLLILFWISNINKKVYNNIIQIVISITIFILIYHSRSSLKWQILLISVFTGFYLIRNLILIIRTHSGINLSLITSKLGKPCLIIILVCLGLTTLTIYQKLTYNSLYFSEMGVRTFWHNLLMGIPGDKKWNLAGPDDASTAEAVILFRKHNDNNPVNWNAQSFMNSLGSHFNKNEKVNWQEYEIWAKKLYFDEFQSRPLQIIKFYTISKPLSLYKIIHTAMFGDRKSSVDYYYKRIMYKLFANPFSLFMATIVFALCLVIIFDPSKQDQKITDTLRSTGHLTSCLIFSAIPSIAFYVVIPTSIVFITVLFSIIYSLFIIMILYIFRFFQKFAPGNKLEYCVYYALIGFFIFNLLVSIGFFIKNKSYKTSYLEQIKNHN